MFYHGDIYLGTALSGEDNEGINEYFNDKKIRLIDYVETNLNRTLTMFKYEGLPNEVKEKSLEYIRQVLGFGGYKYKDGKTYLLKGTFAPPYNYLDQATGLLVANPWDEDLTGLYELVNLVEAKRKSEYEFLDKAVLFRNDPLCRGLLPIFTKYGIMTIENDITFRLANINLRQFMQMIAKDESTKESAEEYFKNIENGKQSIITDDNFDVDGIKGNPLSVPTTFMNQLIETSQYIKASQLNEIGLNANYNMKRERLSESESDLNEDILRPLPDIILEERQKDAEEYADFTGGEVKWTVDFDSVWKKNNMPFTEAVPEIPEEETEEDVVDEETVDEEIPGTEEVTEDGAEETETSVEGTEESTETSDEVAEEPSEDVEETTEEEPSEPIEEIAESLSDIADALEEIKEEIKDEEDDKTDNA